jgi:tetratricopeptide (TPR) repeat protein
LPVEPIELLREGLRCHQAGLLDAAEGSYRRVLDIAPGHADALQLLGLLVSQRGYTERGIALLQQARAANPADACCAANLGRALQRAGRLEESIEPLRTAALAAQQDAGFYNALGTSVAGAGFYAEAAAWFELALALEPAYDEAHNNLIQALAPAAAAYAAQGNWEETVNLSRRLIGLVPHHSGAHYNLGVALAALGRTGDARGFYEEALRLDPANARAANNLGKILDEAGQPEAAVELFRRALAADDSYIDARYNLAVILAAAGKSGEALEIYQQVLSRTPHANSENNMGGILLARNQPAEAIPHYRAALSIEPDHPEAGWNLALAQLTLGDYENGWPAYQARLRQPAYTNKRHAVPAWTGEPLHGKTILVWAEQGLGDTIQFLRYVPLLRQRGARVVVSAQPRLLPLLAHAPEIDHLIGWLDTPPAHDFHAPLMSMPFLFQTTLATIPPPAGPWLLPQDSIGTWQIPHDGSLQAGLCWAGNPGNRDGRKRSAPAGLLPALFQLEGVHLHCLQQRPDMTMLDTAALITQLDLVISVDTMIAHLAASLGKPTWTLLPYAADWRWMLEREDTPWYPTMRLWRQASDGDWEQLGGRVRAELIRVLERKTSV